VEELEHMFGLGSVGRWIELLSDGVIELCPFPHSADAMATSGAATSQEEPILSNILITSTPALMQNWKPMRLEHTLRWFFL
jgi:hypothetical protein